jgi:hypothetical protein
MSLKKDRIIPGTIIVVDNKGKGFNSPVVLSPMPGGYLSGHVYPNVGEEIEIISKPKKYKSINCVKVRYKETDLFVYYCHLKFSTSEK